MEVLHIFVQFQSALSQHFFRLESGQPPDLVESTVFEDSTSVRSLNTLMWPDGIKFDSYDSINTSRNFSEYQTMLETFATKEKWSQVIKSIVSAIQKCELPWKSPNIDKKKAHPLNPTVQDTLQKLIDVHICILFVDTFRLTKTLPFYEQTLVANAYAIHQPDIPHHDIFKDNGVPEREKLPVSLMLISTAKERVVTHDRGAKPDYMFTWEEEKERRTGRNNCQLENRWKALESTFFNHIFYLVNLNMPFLRYG
ncbi:hypothetical protein J3R83DRAFT_11312 [Lanmaoa asiatica]|nr:hypothetical protein J3R83DRAFT_11312 [Lanmaoa asiatica]